MPEYQHFIGGRFVAEPGGERIAVLNPATGDTIADVPEASRGTVDAAVAAARKAQPDWAELPAVERAGYVKAVAQKVRDNVDRLAELISREQGKILDLARGEVLGMAGLMDYMAEWARRIEGDIIESDRKGETIFLYRRRSAWWRGSCPGTSPSS